jgi:hypothetical protein
VSTPTTPTTEAESIQVEEQRPSLGERFADVSKDLSALVRQEIELAKAEAKQSASQAGRGVGMLVGAGLAAYFTLLFLSILLWWGLGNSTGRAWSALITAVVWAVIGAVLAMVGRAQLRQVRGMDRTTETVKRIPDAVKGHEENNR